MKKKSNTCVYQQAYFQLKIISISTKNTNSIFLVPRHIDPVTDFKNVPFSNFLCNTIFLFCENFNVRLAYIRQNVLNHFNATIIFKGFDIDVQKVYLSVHLPLSG